MEDTLLRLLHKKKNHSLNLKDSLNLIDKSSKKVLNPESSVDAVLISKLKAGDHPAFTIIFTAFYKDLVLFAAKFTHDLDSAEEVIQDVFVKLWEDRAIVKINTSLKSYLLKTVQNKCIDWYRHKKIIKAHGDSIKEESPQFYCNSDKYLLQSELEKLIEEAMEDLPKEVSEVFILSRYNRFKYHEIADMLGVSVRTIEVRIGKALQLLRNHLKEYFPLMMILINMVI